MDLPYFSTLGLACGVTFGTTTALIIYLAPVAERIGLVDVPSGRKKHHGKVPLIGGISILIAFTFGVLALPLELHDERPLFAAALLVVGIGVLDDFREISAPSRFGGQILAITLISLWGDLRLSDLGNLLAENNPLRLYFLALPFTVFAGVGGMNALNMIDGVDGLATGLVLITIGALLCLSADAGEWHSFQLLLVAFFACFGFWLFNMRFPWHRRASAFLGDAGSMLLSLIAIWFMIDLCQGTDRAMRPVTALYIYAVPLFDAIFVMLLRSVSRRSLFDADEFHIHHLMRNLGLSSASITTIILVFAIGMASIGVVTELGSISEHRLFLAFIGLFSCYAILCHLAWRRIHSSASEDAQ